MSRSGYCEDPDDLALWRGAVERAMRGKRGRAFLREMIDALDVLPAPRLTTSQLVGPDGCCAMGAVAIHRGIDVTGVDPFDPAAVARVFGIAGAAAAEISYANDETYAGTDEQRWQDMRRWAVLWLKERPLSPETKEKANQ